MEVEALFAAGNWKLEKGLFTEAVTAFRMAAKRAETMGDFTSQLECLQSATEALHRAGAWKEAVEITNEVICFWNGHGAPPWPTALTLTTLARLHLAILEESGDEEFEVPAIEEEEPEIVIVGTPEHENVGEPKKQRHSEVAKGAADEAAAILEKFMEGEDEVTAARASLDLAAAVHVFGKVCLTKNDYHDALVATTQARRLYSEVQDTWGAATVAISQAQAHMGMDQMEEAEEAAQWALDNCEICENLEGAESARGLLSAIRWREEDEDAETTKARGLALDYSRFEAINSRDSDEELTPEQDPQELAAVDPLQELMQKDQLQKQQAEASQHHAADEAGGEAAPETPSPLVSVHFLYASPLMTLEQPVRPLDIRADLQALHGAKGISPHVRVATAENLREVLFSRPGIVQFSVHCISMGGSQYLIFEDSNGAAYMTSATDLAKAGHWDGVDLLVFLSCSSEGLAHELVRVCGLRRVVCCSVQLLDRAAHLFCATFYHALGAGRALLTCHEIARAAVRASPDAAVSAVADSFVLLGEPVPGEEMWRPTPSAPLPQAARQLHWPLWPRVDDFGGRQSLLLGVAKCFESRRALCLWGPRGLGKTAFCHEFCNHYSAPGGRRFSAGVFYLDYAATLRRINGPGDHPDAFATALLAELKERGHPSYAEDMDSLPVSQALRNVARQLDHIGPWLVVIDGLPRSSRWRSGSHSPGSGCFSSGPSDDEDCGALQVPCSPLEALHRMLDELFCISARLCVLLTARYPLRGQWCALGMSKVVEVELPPISPEDAARLLARRAARPFFRRDFGGENASGGSAGDPLPLDQELIRLLVTSPLVGQLEGSPGRILAAAAEVHPGLPSLLCHPWLLPAAV